MEYIRRLKKPQDNLVLLEQEHWQQQSRAEWLKGTLVQDIIVKMLDKSISLHLIGVHPEDGDAFFFIRNNVYNPMEGANLYEYHTRRDDYQKVSTITLSDWRSALTNDVFTLVYPWLPTKIPALPCI